MRKLFDIFAATRPLALLLLTASAGALGFAYISQYVFHYDPCPLCLWQRKPYMAVIALSAVAALLAGRRRDVARALLWVCGLAFTVGAGIALFHTGVEQGWWQGLQSCGDSGMPPPGDLDALRAYLQNRNVVRCDVASWQLFGLSMTAYNLLASLALAGFSFALLRRGRNRP